MGQPSGNDLHFSRPLTNISTAFMQSSEDFIASRVFPVLPVNKKSDLYYTYPKGNWFRDDAKPRAPGTESAGGGYELGTDSYSAILYAFHKDVNWDDRDEADEGIDLDRDATELVTTKMLLRREKDFVDTYLKTGLWVGSTTGGDITPGTLWDAAGSDPVDDVLEQKEGMRAKTGKMPNTLVVSAQVHRALRANATIKDAIKYTQTAIITESLLAGLFEVTNYVVARGSINSALEGAADSIDSMFSGKQAMLVYSEPNPGRLKASAGYIFSWKGRFGTGDAGNRIETFPMRQLKADRIEGEIAFDSKVVATELGVFFDGVIS